jgi:hypothetical protein
MHFAINFLSYMNGGVGSAASTKTRWYPAVFPGKEA